MFPLDLAVSYIPLIPRGRFKIIGEWPENNFVQSIDDLAEFTKETGTVIYGQ